MDDNHRHPITPPPELVQQWWEEADQHVDRDDPKTYFDYIATQAARWGSDQELEACCEYISRWFATPEYRAAELRAARRPKPPSLKEQALDILQYPKDFWSEDEVNTIRRSLESLPS